MVLASTYVTLFDWLKVFIMGLIKTYTSIVLLILLRCFLLVHFFFTSIILFGYLLLIDNIDQKLKRSIWKEMIYLPLRIGLLLLKKYLLLFLCKVCHVLFQVPGIAKFRINLLIYLIHLHLLYLLKSGILIFLNWNSYLIKDYLA